MRNNPFGRDLKPFSPGVITKKKKIYPIQPDMLLTWQNKLSEKQVVSLSLLHFEEMVLNTLSKGKRRNPLIPGNRII